MSEEQVSDILFQYNVKRPIADYVPSFWGDQFLNYDFDEMVYHRREQRLEELKEEVRRELLVYADHPLKQMSLIDAIQRLDVGYHFEMEIEEALQRVYILYTSNHCNHEDENLYNISLFFRILRQNGFKVSSEIFNKFKDGKGNLRESSLVRDVGGMLELYEAAQLRVRGEDILDEALDFTTTQLEAVLPSIKEYPLAEKISHALKQQLRQGIPRLEAKHYISIYQHMPSHNEALLKLAKLDFNLVQSLHRKELSSLSRWWKDLGLAAKLSFARDRLVECYFWSVAVYFEPKYPLAKSILTKMIAITTVIDDVYDAFGTLEELTVFTDAIERWDVNCMDQLPKYMQICYQALLDFFKEIEDEMAKQGRTYRFLYAKEAMKTLLRGYFKEAQWFNAKYIPTVEEHLKLALVTCTYHTLITLSFVGMDETVTKETFEWMDKDPKIVRASSIISRFMDDIVRHKFEQKRGHVASGVECHVKHRGMSEEEVYELFTQEVVNAWKDMNEELLRPTEMPTTILMRPFNFARVMDVLYKEEDNFTHVGQALKESVTTLLIDPVVPNE